MEFFPLLGLAFGLAMDAFSVAVASGIVLGKVTHRQTFRLSFHFGLFQFGMPIIGWALGSMVAQQIASFDHWLAFGLLSLVGGKMLWEALRPGEEYVRGDPTRGTTLVMLATATSIDALAVGLTLAFVRVPVLMPSFVIGVVAAAMTGVGLHLGKRVGHLLGNKMEIMGGLVLFGIGLKILLEHLS